MKILFVVHDYWPEHTAGVENHTHDLAEALSVDHEVYVFTRRVNAPCEGISRYKDGNVMVIKFNDTRNGLGPEESYLNHELDGLFEKELRKIKPDVVHFQHLIGLSLSFIEIAKRNGAKVGITLHDYWFKCPYIRNYKNGENCKFLKNPEKECESCMQSLMPRERLTLRKPVKLIIFILKKIRRFKLTKPIFNVLLGTLRRIGLFPKPKVPKKSNALLITKRAAYFRKYFNMADVIISPSRFLAVQAEKFGIGAGKINIISHGIKLSGPIKRTRRNDKNITFGFISHIAIDKGFALAVHSFINVSKRYPKSRLVIYGTYDKNDKKIVNILKTISRNPKISYMGTFSPENKSKIMETLDVIIVPSLWNEIYGLVIDEAFDHKKPVIVSNRGGVPERVQHGKSGLIFDPNKKDSLEKSMDFFLSNPKRLQKLSKNIRKPQTIKEYSLRFIELFS